MKIFISWSKDLGKEVAETLSDWLKKVIPNIDIFVSFANIDKGARWGTVIAKSLQESNMGIVVVTKESIQSPWLNYEAGALSKHFETSKLMTFLFDIDVLELSQSPLEAFNATLFSINEDSEKRKKEVLKFFISIYKSLSKSFDKNDAEWLFDSCYARLEESLLSLEGLIDSNDTDKKQQPFLEQAVEISYGTQKLLNSSIVDITKKLKAISSGIDVINGSNSNKTTSDEVKQKWREHLQKSIKNQETVFSEFHKLAHDMRKHYFSIEFTDGLNPQSTEEEVLSAYIRGGQVAVNTLEAILSEITGEQVYSCIKLLWNDDGTRSRSPIIYVPKKTQCISLCRSYAGSRRNERMRKDMQDDDTSKFAFEMVSEHSIFNELMLYSEQSYVFYNDISKEGVDDLSKPESIKEYDNPHKDWWKYYNTTLCVPIRTRIGNLPYGSLPPRHDIFGFLCVDTLKEGTFNFNDDKGDACASLIRAFSDILYIYFEKCRRLSTSD
jgi:hypothetical protein